MNFTLSGLFLPVVELSLHGAMALIVVTVLRFLVGKRIAPRYRSFLWLPALLAFLAPVQLLPQNPVALPAQPVISGSVDTMRIQLASQPARLDDFPMPVSVVSDHPIPVVKKRAKPFPWLSLVSIIWLAGAVAMAAAAWAGSTQFRRAVLRSAKNPEPRTLELWRVLSNGAKAPRLVCSYAVSTPVLAGFLRPMVILPAEREREYGDDVLQHIFRHELAHFRRGDLYFLMLERLVLILHWFNPLLWLAHRFIRVDREVGADADALDRMEETDAISYGEALLNVAAGRAATERMPVAVGIFESKKQLATRLRSIAGHRRAGKLAATGVIVAIAVLTLSVFGKPREADLTPYEGMPEDQALVQASLDGDLPAVRHYLKAGPNLNDTVDWYGQKTALSGAASRNQIEIMKLLLDAGADPNFKPTKGWNAWESAIRRGRKEAADLLIERGAVVEERTLAAYYNDVPYLGPILEKEGSTLPFETIAAWNEIAMVNNHVELFRLTLKAGKKHPKVPTWNFPWESGVVTAIARGHKEVLEEFIVLCRNDDLYRFQDGPVRIADAARQIPGMKEWLVERGFKVPDYNTQEELIDASGRGDLFKMKQLLDEGADPNYNGESGWSPVVKAANANKIDAVKLLLANGGNPNSVKSPGANWSALTLCENPKIAEVLFEAGADVNAQLGGGSHIISYPVTFGHAEMIKWFVSKGVDVKSAKGSRPTLLFDAGNAEVAKVLLDNGVDPNVRDASGDTAMHDIARSADKPAPIIKVLLENGANPNAADKQGYTPIMLAKDGETVELLLKHGANPKLKTVDGQSLTEISLYNADVTRIKSLVKQGLKLDEKAVNEMMLRAARSNKVDIIQYLLELGADPNLKVPFDNSSQYFQEPIAMAAGEGHLEALELLLDNGGHPETGLPSALFGQHNDAVALLWKRGARNITESIYLLSQRGSLEAIRKALALEGRKPLVMIGEHMDYSKWHPFAYACLVNRVDVVQLLLPTYRSNPAIMEMGMRQAAWSGSVDVMDLMLKNGFPVSVSTLHSLGSNSNPYRSEQAKAENYVKTLQLIITAGGLNKLTPEQKRSALESAIFTRQPGSNLQLVKLYLDAGVDPRQVDASGKSVVRTIEELRGTGNHIGVSDEVLALLGFPVKIESAGK